MPQQHSIAFVADDALPAGHDFMLIVSPSGAHVFFRASAVTPAVLEDSWAAYRALLDDRQGPALRRTG